MIPLISSSGTGDQCTLNTVGSVPLAVMSAGGSSGTGNAEGYAFLFFAFHNFSQEYLPK